MTKNTACFILRALRALFLLCLLMACSKSAEVDKEAMNFDDPEPTPKLTIENDKVICEICDGFGKIIETYTSHVFVGGERQVWIFKNSGQGIPLIQEIDLSDFGFLNSITAQDGKLFLGVYDVRGTGSVRQYYLDSAIWQFEVTYEIGRNQDNFGNDIAILDTLMVIGASAVWSESVNAANNDEGIFYIYRKEGADWIQTQEFYSENPTSDDRFGTDVIITDNFILVGGLSIPLHIYKLDGMEWKLASVESDIIPADIGNFGNTVLYYSEMLGLRSFRINSDGSIDPIVINANLDLSNGIRFNVDSISMTENHALITTLGGQQVYLLKFENSQWILENTYPTDLGERFEYMAIKLNENLVITSGTDNSDYKSYLYFNTYP